MTKDHKLAEATVFIGARVNDPHQKNIPGKRSVQCARCHLPTNFAPSSFNHPNAAHPLTLFICAECAAAGGANGLTLLVPSEEQVKEVVDAGYASDSFPLKELQGSRLETLGYRYVLANGLWHIEDGRPGPSRNTNCGLAVPTGCLEAFCTIPNPSIGLWAMQAAASDPTVANSEPCETCFPPAPDSDYTRKS